MIDIEEIRPILQGTIDIIKSLVEAKEEQASRIEALEVRIKELERTRSIQ